MARPADLPPAEAFEHGTRSRYVCGCRCDDCTRSNRDAYRKRMKALREAAKDVRPNEGPTTFKLFHRTRKDGTRYEVRGRACPGAAGRPCIQGGVWLRTGRTVCTPCANRATIWNGLVPSGAARAHIKALSAKGVGYKAVAAASDVASSVLAGVLDGTIPNIRAQTEKRILGVDEGARADGSLIPSGPTWKLLNELFRMGFTRRGVSKHLGKAAYASVLTRSSKNRRELITARGAADIERLYRRVTESGLELDEAMVKSGPTYRIIREMLKDFTKRSLCRALDYNIPRKQPKKVRRTTAERILAFYENREADAVEALERTNRGGA